MRGGMDKATANAIQESKICALIELGLDRVKAEELLGLPPSGPAPKPAKNISPEDAVQIFMSQTEVKEIDKAKHYLEIKNYNIQEAVKLFGEQPDIRRRMPPAKEIIQSFIAITGLSEHRARIYLEQPNVNFNIIEAEKLFISDPTIGTGAPAPVAVAPVAPVAVAPAVVSVVPAPNLKDAFSKGSYNVFIAFFRVKRAECQNSVFGGSQSEHITFYHFRVNGKHPREKEIFKDPGNTHGNIHEVIIDAWNKMTAKLGVADTGIILNRVGTVRFGTHDAIQYEAGDDNCWSYFKNNILNHIGGALGCPLIKHQYKMNTHIANGYKYFGGTDMDAGNYETAALMAVVNDHFGKDKWKPHMSTVKPLHTKPLESYPLVINLKPGVDGNGAGWCLRCGIGTDGNEQLL